MSDLISRKDAVSRMSDLLMIELQGQRLPTWNEVYQAMNDMPSAEPEQKTGKWIVHDYALGRERYECAECAGRCDLGYDFCPFCGADMTRGEDESA